jgi:hypothetical protein
MGAMTLSITTTFSRIKLSDTQHIEALQVVMLSAELHYCYAVCHCGECDCTECHGIKK